MEITNAVCLAMDSLYWGTLKSLSENSTLPALKMVDDTVDLDGQLISLKDAREIQDTALDIYLTHLDLIEEIKHRFTVGAMKSLRQHGYIKAELIPSELEKNAILECISLARSLTRI